MVSCFGTVVSIYTSPYLTEGTLPATALGVFCFSSTTTGSRYCLNTLGDSFPGAASACTQNSSQLVSYTSIAEQSEVEQYFVNLGALLPGFHTFYWMGLNSSAWPRFSWIDGSPGPNRTTYQRWGYYMPQNILEPNAIFPPENCAGANFTEGYDGVWAWSDAGCSLKFPYICKALSLGAFYYTSAVSGATYVFNNTPVMQAGAAMACREYGAAPVSYKSLEEQQEVEAYFLSTGRLLADAHKAYWLGLKANTWPAWAWLDKTAGVYNPGVYANWYTSPGLTEPNNLQPPELCVVANASALQRDAWGWADTSCGRRFPYMCKVVGSGATLPPALTSNITGNVFQLYLNKSSQAEAEAVCQATGGHLAGYVSDYEQAEIEAGYVQLGFLVPAFHKTYWMGLQRGQRSGMRWLDGSLPGPSAASYQHWGTYM
jgi:hypothetical protein